MAIRRYACLLTVLLTFVAGHAATGQSPPPGTSESQFLTNIRQLTFDGLRSGEGYFNADGSLMVFQSEREPGNPFYQIYLLDFETAELQRVSPGHGKTTCAWIHPDNRRVLFASTQDDPDALAKQRDELALRESGQQRRYAWDYDDHFELYVYDRQTETYERLTHATGYDAEGSYSPDGQWIAFASNRHGFTEELSPEARRLFEIDRSSLMDIYIMRADGTDVRRLTDAPGYDGGPFFSADGQKICWRRFDEKGTSAEIMTMNVDGSNQRQLTRLGAISWAPYFHPSGQYLIFATNVHGFGNFELYLVDAEGRSPPVRVTETDGFDGLASFTPDGRQLTWTSNRVNNISHLFVAEWNHEAALRALSLGTSTVDESDAQRTAVSHAEATRPDFRPIDLAKHVSYLCLPELAGRMTGSDGERKATAYVAAYLDYLGFEPAGENGTWYQTFPFPAGVRLGPTNRLSDGARDWQLDRDWRPLTFSQNGTADAAGVVFAGYGIVAPAEGEQPAYDSYVHLDVRDKWVLMFRYWPESSSDALRSHLQYHSSIRQKAMAARERGARGVIIVSGPNSHTREELVPLERDFMLATSSIFAISVRDELAQAWFSQAGHDLGAWQSKLDDGQPQMGFEITGLQLAATIETEQVTGYGRNVIGRLPAGDTPARESILIGAHIDHLGTGRPGTSLARDDETTLIHFGADDNASGVAAMLEIAEYLSDQKQTGKLAMKRDLVVAAWSGEELGLHGSKYFVDQIPSTAVSTTHDGTAPRNIYPTIAACLNLDMVGRYEQALILQGIGSSPYWTKAAEKNAVVGLTLKLSPETQLPTDASSFYRAGVPILSAFTGSHQDYHTPRDTPDKLNYQDAARIARLMGLIARGLLADDAPPPYVEQQSAAQSAPRASMRAYLGSIPDYAADVSGVLISGATKGSPAETAGLQAGDVIVELAGRAIENIYDYTYAIDGLRPGQETTIVVQRAGERLELKITPGRR